MYYVSVKGDISVFDASGREVFRTSSFSIPTAVDISSLPAGIYTIRLTNAEGVFSGRVVRE
jgi:hypothetical protein